MKYFIPACLLLSILYSCSGGNTEQKQTTYIDQFGNKIPVVNGDTLCNVLPDSIHHSFPSQFIALSFDYNIEPVIHDNLEVEYEIEGNEKDTTITTFINFLDLNNTQLRIDFTYSASSGSTTFRENYNFHFIINGEEYLGSKDLYLLNLGEHGGAFQTTGDQNWSRLLKQYNTFGNCEHSYWLFTDIQYTYHGSMFKQDSSNKKLTVIMNGYLLLFR